MKNRIDYWTDGTRHPVRLSAYALALIADHEAGRSAAITEALRNFFGSPDHMAAANAFITAHPGMNLSLLIEIAISRHYDRVILSPCHLVTVSSCHPFTAPTDKALLPPGITSRQ